MKKLIYILLIPVAIFCSCERAMDEVYEEIGVPEDDFGAAINEYTLVEEDYVALNTDGEFFGSTDEARILLPAFLDDKYPNLDNRSLVTLNFNINNGDLVDDYYVQSSQYAGLRSEEFDATTTLKAFEASMSSSDITDYLEEIITAEVSEPANGDVYQVIYSQVQEDSYYNVEFLNNNEEAFDAYEVINVVGEQEWFLNTRFGATMSGYDNGTDTRPENEDWFISPEINLAGAEQIDITIDQVLNFLNGNTNTNRVLISSDYIIGTDYLDATWEELVFENIPIGDSFTPFQSERLDISSYANETIHIAFVYDYPDGIAPQWQIRSVLIQDSNANISTGGSNADDELVLIEKNIVFEFSELSRSWEQIDVYQLTAEDYDLLGTSTGRPGDDDYFSENILPENFLPVLLNFKDPGAQPENKFYVEYQFGDSEPEDAVIDLYTYDGTNWVNYQNIEEVTLQFGKRNGIWEPDNTIEYTLASPVDYDFIGGELLTTAGFEEPADNVEFFHSFERRSDRDTYWSDEMLVIGFGLLLDSIDPNAEVGQKYTLTFVTWIGGLSSETINLIKNEEGQWVLNTEA